MNVRFQITLAALCLASFAHGAQPTAAVSQSFGRLPLAFEENRGQADPAVKFLARSQGYGVFVTSNQLVLVTSRTDEAAAGDDAKNDRVFPRDRAMRTPKVLSRDVVRLELVGATTDAQAEGVEKLPGITNYFIGNDPAKWRSNIPNYSKVRLREVYRGIDLVLYGNGGRQLEYDFDVHPGADPSQIGLRVTGAKSVHVEDSTGDLLIEINAGTLRQRLPKVYQESAGGQHPVDAAYEIGDDGVIAFRIAGYNTRRRLVIDPVLEYSTYFGGSGSDYGYGIAVDGNGSAYVTGYAVTYHYEPPVGNTFTMFVAKLKAAGSALEYTTYFGGTSSDYARAIAVDSAGNAYVTGETWSADFPTVSAFQTVLDGLCDAFVAKLNASGSEITYATYLGGGDTDGAYGIAVNSAGNAYVAGWTGSADFPTASPLQATSGGYIDAFVTEMNSSGSGLVYSTFLGGSKDDRGWGGIAVDGSGNAYVSGDTWSTDFPTVAPLQGSNGGSGFDTYVAKLNPSGSALLYSTYLGGSGDDSAYGIAVDPAGNAYVAGNTSSPDFPTVHALQPELAGGDDGFVAKLNTDGSALEYSTFLGGSAGDYPCGIAADASGNAYVAGYTLSTDFPTQSPIQATNNGGYDGYDGFVARLKTSGAALVYSTYLGGSSDDIAYGVAVDAGGNAYTAGKTFSADFPTATPIQPALDGGIDAFVAKISETTADLSVTASATPAPAAPGQTITFTIDVTNHGAPDAENVALTSDIPANTTFAALSQTNDPTFDCATPAVGSTGSITCTIASLLNGDTASFSVAVVVNAAVADGTTITNAATLTTTSIDSVDTNDTATATVRISVPPAPTGLVATAASGPRVNLTWTDNSGNESGFIIQRCTGALCTSWAKIATIGANVTSYADTAVIGSTTYRYRVLASNILGRSAASNIVQVTTLAVPRAPSSLTVTTPSTTSARLAWVDNSTNETGFKIERCKGSTCTNFAQIATVGAGVRTYTNTGLTRATYYRYRVRAYNAIGNSAYSNTVMAHTP